MPGDQGHDESRLAFAVVLPMYNEEKCAETAVQRIFAQLDQLPQRTGIIAVNDGSADETGAILARLQPRFPRLVVATHAKNRGYGGAIKTAYAEAASRAFDYVLVMDSDLTQDPKYILGFIPHMQRGVDLIKGSRYIPGGAAEGVPANRVWISTVGNRLSRLLFRVPLTDFTNGFRAVRIALAQRLALECNGFDLLMEEVYQARYLGATFAEVPYVLRARSKFEGKSTFVYRPRIFYRYLRFGLLACLNRPPRALTSQPKG